MTSPLKDFRDDADRWADQILQRAFWSWSHKSSRTGLGTVSGDPRSGDIDEQFQRLADQARGYNLAGCPFPAVRVPDEHQSTVLVPVDVPMLAAQLSPGSGPQWWERQLQQGLLRPELVGGFLPNAQVDGVTPEPDAIAEAVRRPLRRFLANRLWGQAGPLASPTAPFTVHCRRQGSTCHGMTAFYTPAYFITLGPYGSTLTSPVSGALAPGYYHFGADRPGGGTATIDYSKRFDIPMNSMGTIDA